MDTTRIALRRYELQVAHDAGFFWMDTRGVIATKYAYGGIFGEYALDGESLRLTSPGGTRPVHVGVYGLKALARLVEGDALNIGSCQEWALAWASDCLRANRSPRLRRALVRITYFFPLADESARAKVQGSLLKRFPDAGAAPPGYTTVNSGVSMNALTRSGERVQNMTMQAGIMTQPQITEHFAAPAEDEPEYAFGMITTHEDVAVVDQRDADTRLGKFLERAKSEAQEMKTRVMIPVLANA